MTTVFPRLPPLPDAIDRSPLMRQGGLDIYEGLLDERTGQALLEEAMDAAKQGIPQDSSLPNPEEDRGGIPPRRFLSAPGGPLQQELYKARWLTEALSDITRLPVEPTGALGTFSYYVRPGDYLDLHRDIHSCDLAVLTVLHDNPSVGSAGALCAYPDRHREPLSEIRTSLEDQALVLRGGPRQTVVLFGGVVLHRVLPVAAGQARIVSVLCYRVQTFTGCS